MRTINTNRELHLNGYINELVLLANKQATELYSKYCTIEKSTNAYDRITGISGVSAPIVTGSGENFPIVDFATPQTLDVTYSKRAQKYLVAHEAIYTSKVGKGELAGMEDVVSKPTSLMTMSFREAKELTAANLLTLGHTAPSSSGTPTLDNLALFSASHTLNGGATFSNTGTTALSYDAVEAAIQVMKGHKTYMNTPWFYAGKYNLITPAGLALKDQRIVASTLLPGTAGTGAANDINPVNGMLVAINNPFLTDSNNWYLVKAEDSPLVIRTRMPFEIKYKADYSDGGDAILAHEEWAGYAKAPQHTFGSNV